MGELVVAVVVAGGFVDVEMQLSRKGGVLFLERAGKLLLHVRY
jgi:hypothetical protein